MWIIFRIGSDIREKKNWAYLSWQKNNSALFFAELI
jgi:hypothetical protein